MKLGKLIVFEGTDGSGKSTQFERLTQRLAARGLPFQRLRFPRYDQPSSALIRMYLGGAFGTRPGDVNAYMASAFYAVDRCASWLQDWRARYEQGGVLLADRYTTSNAVHQGGKLPKTEREAFFAWLRDFEYGKLGLPAPDLVLLLDLPIELTQKLMAGRGRDADIHERDLDYLRACRESALHAAAFYGWTVVHGDRDGEIRTIEDVASEIDEKISTVWEDAK